MLVTTSKYNTSASILALGIILLLATCQSEKEYTYNDQGLILGNASPVLLASGRNEINLEDYVLDLSKLDSISVPSELKQSREGQTLYIEGELKSWLGEIKLWSSGQD